VIRHAAFEVLRQGGGLPSRAIDQAAERHGLEGRDLALLRLLLRTLWRRLGSLRAVAAEVARGKPSADISACLHIGLTQLLFLDRVPEHAAVSETVQVANDFLGLAKGRFVNACLREALRRLERRRSGDPRRDFVGRELSWKELLFRDPEQHPLLWAEDALSMPAAIQRGWVQRFGREEAERLARLALEEPPLSVRARGQDPEALLLELELEAEELRPLAVRGGLWLFAPEARAVLLRTPAFSAGRLTVQGESAWRAALLLEAQPGEQLLDLCAAPGGKTAVLAEAGARVTATDVDPSKLELLRQTLERLGLSGAVEPLQSDGAAALGERRFDGVLIDAPCSNTGVLAGRPEARWRFGPQGQRELGQLQERLLEQGSALVRPGGRLVWSTCSIEPGENQARVSAFLRAHPGWALEAVHEARPDFETGPVDGGYAARLRAPRS
jgi:16S rRNA (cytosine967-C5)-methyltransferase